MQSYYVHRKNFQSHNIDPLVRGTDPRIRIRTKMSQIRNTAPNTAVQRILKEIHHHYLDAHVVKGAEPGGPAEAVGPPGRHMGGQQQREGGTDGSTPGSAWPLQGAHREGHHQLPALAQAVEHSLSLFCRVS
jgi:hypothetical protein